MPRVASIIPCEMQTGEAQRHTSNLLQNSNKEERRIKNVDAQVEF
jgi:hypothetical protein